MKEASRAFTYLCPCCQTERKVMISARLDSGQDDAEVWLNAKLYCPKCTDRNGYRVKMYQADELLIPALKLLNSKGYATVYSCDRYHNGTEIGPYHKDTTEMHTGPFISIAELNKSEFIFLEGIVSDWTRFDIQDTYKYRLQVQYTHWDTEGGLMPVEITKVIVEPDDQSLKGMRAASKVLSNLIAAWLTKVENHHLEHSCKYIHMQDCSNNSYMAFLNYKH